MMRALHLAGTRSSLAVLFLSFSVVSGQEREVTIHVVQPSSTPADASIFVAGNAPQLGQWDPGKIRMSRQNDSLWTLSTRVPQNSVLEFKITRGTWATEALYIDGVIPSNTVVRVESDTVVRMHPLTWSDISPARQNRASKGGIVGTVRYHRGLKGDGLKYDRDVIVWLPPSYPTETKKRYPVLYMHDGQNVFDPQTSFIGYEWRADEVADSMIKANAIEEIIIVGIYNSPDRISEYSDTPLGRHYARFVVERVKTLIDSVYRTKPSRENTAVMGSSMGGLISLLFVWWYPDVFSKAACLSTAISPDERNEIINEIRDYRGPKKELRIYLDVGGLEPPLVPGFEALTSVLEDKGYRIGTDLESFFDKSAVHNEQAWAHRLWRPLIFLFGL